MRAYVVISALFLTAAFPSAAQVSPSACERPPASKTPPTQHLLLARNWVKQACAADKAAFCAGVPPGCGRPMRCLRAHGDQLASDCRTALEQLHAASIAKY
jgi:hypothetical protein